MTKKKNTLKDLDEFLKQQAATLVPPTPLGEKTESPTPPSSDEHVASEETITLETIFHDLQILAKKEGPAFREKFYSLIIQSIEDQSDSLPEDKMLINTALYLKSGDQWKEVIRHYWQSRNSNL